jgi:3-methyladenine DNA glycosylase AlkD
MDLNRKTWSETEYNEFYEYLNSFAQKDYAGFVKKLNPDAKDVLGVRIPIIRKIAKQVCSGNWRGFLVSAGNDTFEEVMLQGMIIGYAKADITEIIVLLKNLIEKIDNWGTCDCVCAGLHITRKYKTEMLIFLQNYLFSSKEFEVRFSVVMLMNYYIEEEYIDYLLKTFNAIIHEGYYAKMSVAWALSFCFVKFPVFTMAYLKDNSLDDYTYNKTLQKIIESFRVDEETKIIIKSMKRNK